jgi:hypothetical protein
LSECRVGCFIFLRCGTSARYLFVTDIRRFIARIALADDTASNTAIAVAWRMSCPLDCPNGSPPGFYSVRGAGKACARIQGFAQPSSGPLLLETVQPNTNNPVFFPDQFTPDLLEPTIRSGRSPRSHSHHKDFLDLRVTAGSCSTNGPTIGIPSGPSGSGLPKSRGSWSSRPRRLMTLRQGGSPRTCTTGCRARPGGASPSTRRASSGSSPNGPGSRSASRWFEASGT